MLQSAAKIPTSSAATTNARLAKGVCALPRIAPKHATMASLRLTVWRGNSLRRILAATLTSTTIRSLPSDRIMTGRAKRFDLSMSPLMMLPQASQTEHGNGVSTSSRPSVTVDNSESESHECLMPWLMPWPRAVWSERDPSIPGFTEPQAIAWLRSRYRDFCNCVPWDGCHTYPLDQNSAVSALLGPG